MADQLAGESLGSIIIVAAGFINHLTVGAGALIGERRCGWRGSADL